MNACSGMNNIKTEHNLNATDDDNHIWFAIITIKCQKTVK